MGDEAGAGVPSGTPRSKRDEHAPQGPAEAFAVALRFDPKQERRIDVSEARAEMEAGAFVWIDLDLRNEGTRETLAALGVVHPEILEDAFDGEPATQVARYEGSLHVALTAARLHGRHFELERVDLVLSEKYLVTLHRTSPHFLRVVKKQYRDDFMRFARSPSFLLYELWDHLIEDYLAVQKRFEERVEKIQAELATDVDDGVFAKISELGADLLHFRKVLLPARAVLTDLSTRKSPFISEATQPFLGNMVGTIERVLQDLLVDRDILSESLNLYMSMVGHRTNRVMNRLTVVSVIFLPLTFLCGVYGMNFEVLPETRWEHGYAYFWALTLAIVVGLVGYMRHMRLL